MRTGEVLGVAAYAGQIILENGGETYRVEETIEKICKAYGLEQGQSFVTPTGIMASGYKDPGDMRSLIIRIKSRTVNLDKIEKVNALSRLIYHEKLTVEEFRLRLAKIDARPTYHFWINVLFAGIAAGAFAIMYGGSLLDGISAFFVGLVVKYLVLWAGRYSINDFFINLSGGALVSGLGMILSYIGFGENPEKIIIGSIMLLVPGLAITNAIRDTLAGDLVAGMARAMESFLVAVSLAAGAGVVVSLWFKLFGGY
jgi:uncharacterized membrane protein YjjP (DUF1212 family)